jgi:hypothetical protein
MILDEVSFPPEKILNSYMEKKFNTTSFEGRQWQVIYLFIFNL